MNTLKKEREFVMLFTWKSKFPGNINGINEIAELRIIEPNNFAIRVVMRMVSIGVAQITPK